MPAKPSYNFVLWAVPRFHRAGAPQPRHPAINWLLQSKNDEKAAEDIPAAFEEDDNDEDWVVS